MLLTVRQRRLSIAGGGLAFAGILFFIGFAVLMLLLRSEGDAASLFGDRYVLTILRFTLWQAFLSTLLSVLLALPVARALARQPHLVGRRWILRLMGLPMGLPALIGALGLVGIWGRQGLINSTLQDLGLTEPVSIYGLSGILLAHVFFNLPLACRLMLAALERVPSEYWLTASSLGMQPRAVFRLIEWPALRGILPGLAGLIFMLCATSFTLVLMLGGGPAATTVEVAIYQALRFDFDPARAVALCLLQILTTSVVLALLQFVGRPPEEGMTAGRPTRRLDGVHIARRALDRFVVLLAAAFVAAPMASIVVNGLRADLSRLAVEALFWRALATSLIVSVAAASLSVLVSVVSLRARDAIMQDQQPKPVLRMLRLGLSGTSSLVLLVPPLVLGTGWFIGLRLIGLDLSHLAPILVVIINMLMALPFVMRVLEPAFGAHEAKTLKLCASLGISGFARWRWVDWPVLRAPLFVALSFAMALSLGDLGAVALFGSDGFVTLPWLIYSQLGNYRSADAQGYAFLLALLCFCLTLIGTSGNSSRDRS